jgi:hypothetical protein
MAAMLSVHMLSHTCTLGNAEGHTVGDNVGSLGLGGANGAALDTVRSRELVETVGDIVSAYFGPLVLGDAQECDEVRGTGAR